MRVLVADRLRTDFDVVSLGIRRFLTKEIDRHFAGWVVSPSRGRFIVFSIDDNVDLEMGEVIQFQVEEIDLVTLIQNRIDTYNVTDLYLCVVPELDQRLTDRFKQ